MRKQQLKVIANLATILLLCITLLISISFGWYTNNTTISSDELHATTDSDNLVISNQGAYSTQIGKEEEINPYPDQKNEVTGILAGDIVYFSVSVKSANEAMKLKSQNIKISFSTIIGDEYFAEPPVEISNEDFINHYSLQGDPVGTYEKKERELHPLYLKDGKYYYVNIINNIYYINYINITSKGNMSLSSKKEISQNEYNSYITTPGSKTEYIYSSNHIFYNTYKENTVHTLKYTDSNGNEKTKTYPATGKEFFITSIDGVYYINYIYETFEKNSNGEILTDSNGNKIMRRYNMLDVYTYEVYKVYGRNDLSQDEYTTIYDSSDTYEGIKFTKDNPLDKSVTMFTLFQPNDFPVDSNGWIDDEYVELTFTFKFVFDYEKYANSINVSSVSYREIKFNNIVISEVSTQNTTEETNGGTS